MVTPLDHGMSLGRRPNNQPRAAAVWDEAQALLEATEDTHDAALALVRRRLTVALACGRRALERTKERPDRWQLARHAVQRKPWLVLPVVLVVGFLASLMTRRL